MSLSPLQIYYMREDPQPTTNAFELPKMDIVRIPDFQMAQTMFHHVIQPSREFFE